ncbi:melanoma cell adhesion molecule b isoform X3 [Channa argus]|uniref:melanoma cell adhesion molecule b isoform X3 n=1 Tax=Channa argus TaxID=215402 RepID=UPI003521743E
MGGRNTSYLLVGLVVLFHTWKVWAYMQVNTKDRVEVLRDTVALISCMFASDKGTDGLEIKWFFVQRSNEVLEIYHQNATTKEVKQNTQFSDRITFKDLGVNEGIVLIIDKVKLEDQVEFICVVKGLTAGSGEGRTKLKVFETPDAPTIEGVDSGFLPSEDSPSKIGVCEVKNGFPKPNITWYKNHVPLQAAQDGVEISPSSTVESSGLFSVKSELRMKVMKEDNNALFYCEVNFFVPWGTRMTETKRINITVLYPTTAVNMWVESPKGIIKEGDTIELRCQGNGNKPSVLTISHKNQSVDGDGTSVMVLNNVTRLSSGEYNCTSWDLENYDEIFVNTKVFVNYLDPAVILPKDPIVVDLGKVLKATCNALSSLNTSTTWFKDQDTVFSYGHTLMVEEASFDTAGTYTCVVTVPEMEKMETSGTLHVSVRGAPEILREYSSVNQSFEESDELTCFVRGFPAPSITWTTSDGKVFKTASQTETDKGIRSIVNIKATSDSTVFCNASNEHGTVSMAFNVKAKSSGVVIAIIIICILLLAILGSVLYFLYKTGKICGRSGKQDLTKEKSSKDNIVVEMKSDNTEEAILLGVNGEKQLSSDQGGEYMDVQN